MIFPFDFRDVFVIFVTYGTFCNCLWLAYAMLRLTIVIFMTLCEFFKNYMRLFQMACSQR